MSRAILFSGGLDSVMMWLEEGADADLLYVRWDGRYEEAERRTIDSLLDLAREHQVPTPPVVTFAGPSLGVLEQKDGHVPLRNTHLVAAAASLGYDEVLIGSCAGETSPDKSHRWMRRTSRALSEAAGHRVRITAPLLRRTKASNLTRVLNGTGAPHAAMELLRGSRSCYAPAGRCGACMACFRRWVAMSLNGIEEPHVQHPARWEGTRPTIGEAWGYVSRAPVREWPAIIRSNVDADRALRRWHHGREQLLAELDRRVQPR